MWRGRFRVVARQPFIDIENIVLLSPHESGKSLALYQAFIGACTGRVYRIVEFVRLALAPVKNGIGIRKRRLGDIGQ